MDNLEKNINWDEVVKFYQTGKTQAELAEVYEVSQSHISKKIAEMGVERVRKVDRIDWDEVRDLYETGKYTHKKLGEIFNVSPPTIGNWLQGKIMKPSIDWDQVAKLYKTGCYSQRELAEIFGTSQSYVNIHLKDCKLEGLGEKIDWSYVAGLYRTGGYTYKDISEMYNVSPSSARNYIIKNLPNEEKGE